jgi:hypothetical protein
LINGYLTEYEISKDSEFVIPACKRFANLYEYVRILRSTAEKWQNEPEWLIDLRGRLEKKLKEKSALFGTDLAPLLNSTIDDCRQNIKRYDELD